MRQHPFVAVAFLCCALLTACGEPTYSLTPEQLMDPEACRDCHPDHYRQWQSSMHAYAADDPVFIAMNARGQEETGGALGDFCVKCHAPMALRTGATTDGLNLDELPQHLKGVTCYFCHSVSAVEGTHNNPLVLADDGVMRGGISDPVENGAHRMAYSPLHDRNSMESSALCGTCHDIVTQAGVHLERTYKEWQESVFASPDPLTHLSCSRCHMQGDTPGVVADFEGVPLRYPKDHSFPGVDIALTPWPDKDLQIAAVMQELDGAVKPLLCPEPPGPDTFIYTLDNVFAGHMLPSGAASDRRVWVELIAYDESGEVLFQSGAVADGERVTDLPAQGDDQLWQIRDFAYKENGEEAHFFWEVREVDSQLLPPAVTNDPSDPRYIHAVSRRYIMPAVPARVTARVRLQPIGLDILDELIASGHLDPQIRDEMLTFTLPGTELEWRQADHGLSCVDRRTR